jgi:hypothetical protein
MMTAPPKMQYKSSVEKIPKLMRDAQKSYSNMGNSEVEGKVYIPEIIEESDSESDSFGERLRRLNDEGQSSKQDDKREHLWMVQVDPSNPSLPKKTADIPVKDTDLNK